MASDILLFSVRSSAPACKALGTAHVSRTWGRVTTVEYFIKVATGGCLLNVPRGLREYEKPPRITGRTAAGVFVSRKSRTPNRFATGRPESRTTGTRRELPQI